MDVYNELLDVVFGDNEARSPTSPGFLYPVTPNPANPQATVQYELYEAAHVKLDLYDVTGRKISTLVDGFVGAGTYAHTVTADNLATGVYFAVLRIGAYQQTEKLVILK